MDAGWLISSIWTILLLLLEDNYNTRDNILSESGFGNNLFKGPIVQHNHVFRHLGLNGRLAHLKIILAYSEV